MAVGIAPSLANSQLNAELGTAYIQLHTGDPGSAGTAHVASTTRLSGTFSSASAGSSSLASAVSWTAWADGPLTLTHITLWSAASAGTFKRSIALTTPTAVVNGGTFQLATCVVSYDTQAA